MQLKIRHANPSDKPTTPPCSRAKELTYVNIEQFVLTGDPAVDVKIRESWRSAGSSHREKGNILYRDVTRRDWFFLWQATGQLRELVDAYGPVVLRRTVANNAIWEVVIGAADVGD